MRDDRYAERSRGLGKVDHEGTECQLGIRARGCIIASSPKYSEGMSEEEDPYSLPHGKVRKAVQPQPYRRDGEAVGLARYRDGSEETVLDSCGKRCLPSQLIGQEQCIR